MGGIQATITPGSYTSLCPSPSLDPSTFPKPFQNFYKESIYKQLSDLLFIHAFVHLPFSKFRMCPVLEARNADMNQVWPSATSGPGGTASRETAQ